MKVKVAAATILLGFLCNFVFAETVYLKDGKLLKCRIVNEDEKTIFVETDTEWKRILKNDIEEIKKEENELNIVVNPEQKNSNIADTSKNKIETTGKDELILKVSLDIMGMHKASLGMDSQTVDIPNSLSLSGEYVFAANDILGIGAGASYQFPRKFEIYEYYHVYQGEFRFVPFYVLAKVHTKPDLNNNYFYIVGHLGYNLFSGNSGYAGDCKLKGGSYYGIGTGIYINKFIIELLYTENNGEISATVNDYYTYSADIKYAKIGFSVGLAF